MLPKSGYGTAPLASRVPGSGWLRLRNTARCDVKDPIASADTTMLLASSRSTRVLEGGAQLEVANHQVRRIEIVRGKSVFHQEHRVGVAGRVDLVVDQPRRVERELIL